jgi:hypothetical protein
MKATTNNTTTIQTVIAMMIANLPTDKAKTSAPAKDPSLLTVKDIGGSLVLTALATVDTAAAALATATANVACALAACHGLTGKALNKASKMSEVAITEEETATDNLHTAKLEACNLLTAFSLTAAPEGYRMAKSRTLAAAAKLVSQQVDFVTFTLSGDNKAIRFTVAGEEQLTKEQAILAEKMVELSRRFPAAFVGTLDIAAAGRLIKGEVKAQQEREQAAAARKALVENSVKATEKVDAMVRALSVQISEGMDVDGMISAKAAIDAAKVAAGELAAKVAALG